MDSKIKRLTVLAMLGIMVVVAAIIVVFNYDRFVTAGSTAQEKQTQEVQASALEEDGMVKGADLSAFLKDDTFFDQEKNTYEKQQDQESAEGEAQVSLLATSVEKDIRIKIVDADGNPVTGYPFALTVQDLGDFQDTDEDGMVYIEGVRPGQYEIDLTDAGEYACASPTLDIRVKAIVSYTTIDDISYLIRSEEEVNVAVEDTEADEVDGDDTQYTALLDTQSQDNPVELGIDVSKWNGEIDWDVVKAEGVDYAIIRCGYRGSSSGWLIEDPYFWQNLQGAKKAGIKVGIYFFTQATTMVEAVEEASMVVTLLGGEAIDYPVFIDTEGAGGNGRADGLDTDTRTIVCESFCKTIENAGYQAGVYASCNWYRNNLNMEKLSGYKIWLAEYRQTPQYEGRYDMWQYTSSGSVAGIEGRVDLNVSYSGDNAQ